MQNDFVRVGAPLEVPDARETIDVHQELIGWFRDRRRPVVFTRFVAGPRPTLMWNWSPVIAPPTCCCWPGFMRSYPDVDGERDCVAVIDELAPLPGDHQVEKYGYSAFHRTRLNDLLHAEAAATVVITRTVAPVCATRVLVRRRHGIAADVAVVSSRGVCAVRSASGARPPLRLAVLVALPLGRMMPVMPMMGRSVLQGNGARRAATGAVGGVE